MIPSCLLNFLILQLSYYCGHHPYHHHHSNDVSGGSRNFERGVHGGTGNFAVTPTSGWRETHSYGPARFQLSVDTKILKCFTYVVVTILTSS